VANVLEDLDITRINDRLTRLAQIWSSSDTAKGSDKILVRTARFSFIDALSCEAYLADGIRVRKRFEQPFKAFIDTHRLSIEHYLPGATLLLFDPNSVLSEWALSIWSGYSSTLTQQDFDFAVREPLTRIFNQASFITGDATTVERLWRGMRLIFERLNSDLITHSFRAMEVDIFKLCLEHLQYDTSGLAQLLQTLRTFLELGPKDFWESMGAISPLTVVESVFNNKQSMRFLSGQQYASDATTTSKIFDWIKPFVASLDIIHQAQACRTLTSYLLDKFQTDDFPVKTKVACFRAGLKVIKWTSLNCNKEHPLLGQIGRIVAAELLEVISIYIRRILVISALPLNDPFSEDCSRLCFDVVELALTLECKCLRTDQEILRHKDDIDPGTCSYAPAIWEVIVQQLDRRNTRLAEAALSGINGLTGLEKFETKKDTTHKNFKSDFNVRLGHFTHLVCLMLERINDFDPSDLDKLFQHPTTATGLVASLFSPDASTYEAGVNLIKSISMESARKEAIRHILTPYFETTLNSLSRSLRRIANMKTYAACPRMLKTCGDVFDILCDSQNGLLRTRQLLGSKEVLALENFWEHQWGVLTVIYEMTEPWSRAQVAESEVLKEFVRDTMDFSERIFDQYGIFASAVDSVKLIKEEDGASKNRGDLAAKKLLEPPAKTMEVIVKWLRLREIYLASMSVKLTTKVLARLSEKSMRLAKEPSDFVELVVRGGSQGRTNLSPQEKAELARALEENLGRSIEPAGSEHERSSTPENQPQRQQILSKMKKKSKNGTIDLDSWRSISKPPPQVVDIPDDDEFGNSDILDKDILAMSRSVEMIKNSSLGKTLQSLHDEAGKKTAQSMPGRKAIEKKKEEQRLAEGKSFREKRLKEIEAKKKRDAEQVAMIRKRVPAKGSGLDADALGVRGKDHAPKGSGVMVSSGSEDDPDDEVDQALFGNTTKAPKISAAVEDYQINRLKQIKEQGPVKKTRQVRSAKDMRARLAPDLTSLHKTILGWEYFHSGDFPPGSDRDDYSLVSNSFRAPNDYQNVFEPLLILEAWQGFMKTKEENSFKCFDIKVANRLTVDSFVEVSTTISTSEGKELGIAEADVILMSRSQSPAADAQQPHCLARVYKIKRKKASMDISYRVNVGNPLLSAMVPNATLYGVKILSLTPLEREYGALLGLKYFDLCDEVIKARPSPLLEYSGKQLGPLEVKYKVNTAQAKAIRSAIDNDAFTLIQGPPGSGKTKTIVAIVGALLSGQFEDKGIPISRPQTNDVRAQQRVEKAAVSKKLLVCAPSNAAVDELVMRFKEGVKTLNGGLQKPAIVRLGRSDAISTKVLDVTLEELVNQKLNITKPKQNGSGEEIHQIMMSHKATCDEINVLRATMDANKASGQPTSLEHEQNFEMLKRKKQQLSNKIDTARDSGDMVARDAEINRRKVQQEILDSAHVICATLSGSGHEMFQNLNIEFESVIIDEAAQSIELSALIPLKYGCAKCILVGDPKQLPPTVLSREAARFQYEQSLFVRMQQNHPKDVHLLDTQYRMHPEISRFPSKEFYDGRLLDGDNMAKLRAKPWHQSAILGPYRFFDVQGVQQNAPRGHSLINIAETEMALRLFARLTTDCTGYDFKGKVGIITPYKSQLRELRSRFAQQYGEAIFSMVEFNTTDAFQGRESEVIIFSCVRAAAGRGIGFLSDIRRMNVGITRAKSSLWVLGNSQSLMQGEFWRRLIEDARLRNRFSGAEVMESLQKPLFKFDPRSIDEGDRSPASSTSTVRNDIEMPDAPVIGAPPGTTQQKANIYPRTSEAAKVNRVDTVSTTTSKGKSIPSSFMPSGGNNGLNTRELCGVCGSATHFTFACDNAAAKNMTAHKCHRCGSIEHRKEYCTADRCLDCGDFGHSSQICTNPRSLSKADKERVSISEASHKRARQRQPEVQTKRALGEHALEIPVVRATSKTPPPAGDKHAPRAPQQNTLKRRRDSSPPPLAPKGPSGFKDHRSHNHRNGSSNTSDRRGREARPASGPNGLPQSLPLRSPTLRPEGYNNRPPSDRPPTTPRLPPRPPQNEAPSSANRTPQPPSSSNRPQALPNKPPASTLNPVKPPTKRRKDANPLLMPNKKRR